MKDSCRTLRLRAAEKGAAAVRAEPMAADHLDGCADCRRAVEALAAVDDALDALPRHDASDAVVDSLLARVAQDVADDGTPKAAPILPWRQSSVSNRRPWIRPLVAAAAVSLVALSASLVLRRDLLPEAVVTDAVVTEQTAAGPSSPKDETLESGVASSVEELLADVGPDARLEQAEERTRAKREAIGRDALRERLEAPDSVGERAGKGDVSYDVSHDVSADMRASYERLGKQKKAPEPPAQRQNLEAATVEESITVVGESPLLDERKISKGTTVSQIELEKVPTARDPWAIVTQTPGVLSDRINVGSDESDQSSVFRSADQENDAFAIDGVDVSGMKAVGSAPTYYDFDAFEGMQTDAANATARAFLAERERTEGLRLQSATGYWSNTYLPGDPRVRGAAARIDDEAAVMVRAVRPLSPSFDPPRRAAMALHLTADRGRVDGTTRTLVEVGLRATDHHRGSRPALDVALVLDLGMPLDAASVDGLRALLEASLEAAEPGDRFGVYFAGRQVAPVVADAFRHGAVMVAFEDALASPIVGGLDAVPITTASAARAAMRSTRAQSATLLGSASVMVVSARPTPTPGLASVARHSARAGVGVSVLMLGAVADRAAYAEVALGGHGNLWRLRSPADAADLIARELNAAGRVVARALRLDIRLAPGVELVEVVGARRLDAVETAREKAAESAIDDQVAAAHGIRANRGEDDAGIQILIPVFHAGDHHRVLLDVVVPGPGRAIDATLRYKDLVRSKNGKAQAHLKLRAGDPRDADDALRQRVRRGLVAQRLHDALDAAGTELARGDIAAANALLESIEHLISGLAQASPRWAADARLIADLEAVRVFRAQLTDDVESADARRLVDALRLAAARTLGTPTPLEPTVGR